MLREPVSVVLGQDETLQNSAGEVFRRFLDDTAAYWRDWVRDLAIPFEWQERIIRAAITLKLNAYEDTGAIVAAVTTSIPESLRQRPQLGLPLLLAARRLLRRERAQPPERNADDGALPGLHRQRRGRRRRPRPAARLCDQRQGRNRRARGGHAARLPRNGAGARRQPGVPADPERRVRRGGARRSARFFRRAVRAAGRRGAVSPPRAARRARRRPLRPARRRPLGAARRRRKCIPSPASCAGPRATGWRRSPPGSGSPSAPRIGAAGRTPCTP